MRGLNLVGSPVSLVTRRRSFSMVDLSTIPVVNQAVVSITTDAVAHTKGAWTEFVASTTADIYAITVDCVSYISLGLSSTLLDIGVGAAASEVVVAPNINVGSSSGDISGVGGKTITIPIFIPRGSRVAGRLGSVRTAVALGTVFCAWGGLPGVRRPAANVLDLNAHASSMGVVVAAATTKVELVAATPQPLLGVAMGVGLATDVSAASGTTGRLTLYVGSASNEVVIGAVNWKAAESTERMAIGISAPGPLGWIESFIPAGVRLSVGKEASTTINNGDIDVSIYGAPYV